jgi:hypothetical protein
VENSFPEMIGIHFAELVKRADSGYTLIDYFDESEKIQIPDSHCDGSHSYIYVRIRAIDIKPRRENIELKTMELRDMKFD